ncbi:nucleosome assembly protein [Pelomyxa schiedti]|nr:nucleosome assembly protein [Pelomyxa schiedti]
MSHKPSGLFTSVPATPSSSSSSAATSTVATAASATTAAAAPPTASLFSAPGSLVLPAFPLSAAATKKPLDDNLSNDVRKRLHALRSIQDEHAKLMKQLREEQEQLEHKYELLAKPLFDKRGAIVKGDQEPSEEQCAGFVADASAPTAPCKGIPQFWRKAILHNETLCQLSHLSPHDPEALDFLQDISVENLPKENPTIIDGKERYLCGFKLTFTFAPNPFFTDAALFKSYFFFESAEDPESQFHHADSAKPNWKDGKDLTVMTRRKKAKGKVAIMKAPRPSFFEFFTPLPALLGDPEPLEEEQRSLDVEVGIQFKDDICPNALKWYLGEVVSESTASDEEGPPGDSDDDDEDEEDDDEGEEQEEDEEGEGDEEDEEKAMPRHYGGPKSKRPRCAPQVARRGKPLKEKSLFSPSAPTGSTPDSTPGAPAPPPECKNQ